MYSVASKVYLRKSQSYDSTRIQLIKRTRRSDAFEILTRHYISKGTLFTDFKETYKNGRLFTY